MKTIKIGGLRSRNRQSNIHCMSVEEIRYGYLNAMCGGRMHREFPDLARPGRRGDGNDGTMKGSKM